MKRKIIKHLNATGKKCCDICDESHILVQHHISGRKILSYDSWWNIANICANCHNLVHHGIIIIEGWFKTTNGFELFWHHSDNKSFTGNDCSSYIIPKSKV